MASWEIPNQKHRTIAGDFPARHVTDYQRVADAPNKLCFFSFSFLIIKKTPAR
jgi:hypothetical protein